MSDAGPGTAVRIQLPTHLRTLAGVEGEVRVEVEGERPSISAVLDVLEARFPTLRGTIREHGGGPRRAYMRYFACGEDISHDPADGPLPEAVTRGDEPVQILGAISGG